MAGGSSGRRGPGQSGGKDKDPSPADRISKQVQRFIGEKSEDHADAWEIDEDVIESLTLEDILHLPIYREGRNTAGQGDKAMFQVRISGSLMRALERAYEKSKMTFGGKSGNAKPFDLWADYQRYVLYTAALVSSIRFAGNLGTEDLVNMSEQEDLFFQETIPEILSKLKKSLGYRTASRRKMLFGRFMSRVSSDTQDHYDAYFEVMKRDPFFSELLDDWRKWHQGEEIQDVDDKVEGE